MSPRLSGSRLAAFVNTSRDSRHLVEDKVQHIDASPSDMLSC